MKLSKIATLALMLAPLYACGRFNYGSDDFKALNKNRTVSDEEANQILEDMINARTASPESLTTSEAAAAFSAVSDVVIPESLEIDESSLNLADDPCQEND